MQQARLEQAKPAPSVADKPAERQRTRSAKLSYNEQRELERLPGEIESLETLLTQVQASLLDPATYQDQKKAREMQQQVEQIETDLLQKMERWEQLEARQQGS